MLHIVLILQRSPSKSNSDNVILNIVYNVEYCVKIGIHSRSPTSSSWKKIWNNVILNIESYIEFCIFFFDQQIVVEFCNYSIQKLQLSESFW
jgi:hypothetical protein